MLATNKVYVPILHEACLYGHSVVISFLLQAGMDSNSKRSNGQTALFSLVQNTGDCTLKSIQLLINHGIDINSIDTLDNNVLYYLVGFDFHDDPAVVQKLVEVGIQVWLKEHRWAQGNSALHLATKNGLLEITKYLVDEGLEVNATNHRGETALITARPQYGIIELLVSLGGDVDKRTSQGHRPNAVERYINLEHFEIVRFLLTKSKMTPYKGLLQAAKKGNLEIVKLLIDHSVPLNHPFYTKLGTTPLLLAVRIKYWAVVEYLLRHGAALYVPKDNQSLLIKAAAANAVEVVQLLLDMKMEVNVTDKNNWNALMHATNKGHLDMITLLIEQGANIHQISRNDNETALSLALSNARMDLYDLLNSYGAQATELSEKHYKRLIRKIRLQNFSVVLPVGYSYKTRKNLSIKYAL